MTITLTNEKKQKILKLCTAARLTHTLTIRELPKLIGNLVASMKAVSYGRLFYRQLERDKINLLNRTEVILKQRLHFQISPKTNSWENIMTGTTSLKKLSIDTTTYTDASLDGWGQFVKNLRQEPCGPNKSRHYTSMLLNF